MGNYLRLGDVAADRSPSAELGFARRYLGRMLTAPRQVRNVENDDTSSRADQWLPLDPP